MEKNNESHLAKVLGPLHVWALGVGLVLVGQYAMAKYLQGPRVAFNVGLMLVFEYVML